MAFGLPTNPDTVRRLMDDICMICGKEYDPMMEPMHEDNCEDKLAEAAQVKVKTNPTLTNMLENLLNGTKETDD